MKVNFKKNEISQISKNILDKVLKTNNERAIVVALSGELGAGKTTLTQEIAKSLGIKEKILSPTFVIMKIYNINSVHNKFKRLIHIDAYRLDKPGEILTLGWEEIILNKDNLVIVEWPERVAEIIPNDSINILISHVDENQRQINF